MSILIDYYISPLVQDWKDRGIGIKVADTRHTIANWADDFFFFAKSVEEGTMMIEEFGATIKPIGWSVLKKKTGWLANIHVVERTEKLLYVNGSSVERSSTLVCLGGEIADSEDRTGAGWRAGRAWKEFYAKSGVLCDSALPVRSRLIALNREILPSMCYSCETWTPMRASLEEADVHYLSMAAKIAKIQKSEGDTYVDHQIRTRRHARALLNSYRLRLPSCFALERRWRYSARIAFAAPATACVREVLCWYSFTDWKFVHRKAGKSIHWRKGSHSRWEEPVAQFWHREKGALDWLWAANWEQFMPEHWKRREVDFKQMFSLKRRRRNLHSAPTQIDLLALDL